MISQSNRDHDGLIVISHTKKLICSQKNCTDGYNLKTCSKFPTDPEIGPENIIVREVPKYAHQIIDQLKCSLYC